MKDRGWPHARSTAGSPDAIIAIGRERGRHRAQEGRRRPRHRHTGAAAERPMSRCGGSSSATPTLPPHTPCARVPPARHAQPSAEPVGGSQLPSPPPAGRGAAAPSSLLSTPSRLGNDCERLLENS